MLEIELRQPLELSLVFAPGNSAIQLQLPQTAVAIAYTASPSTAIILAAPPPLSFSTSEPSPVLEHREVLPISEEGAYIFTLSHTSRRPHLSSLFLNGVRTTYGDDYVINATTLTWIASLSLLPSDELEILYL
jgi:hypothetical protein